MLVCSVILGLVAAVAAQGNVPCGVSVVQPIMKKIVGGDVAVAGSWPWTVMLVDDQGYISGGGVLLDKHVVITSAQHFEGNGYNIYDQNLDLWRVYAGQYNISATDPYEQYYHLRRVVLHPGYNVTSLENDIALVITDETMEYNDHTRPACLPDSSTEYEVGQQCYLAGWGSTVSTGNEETLNQLLYPILDDEVCSSYWTDFLPNNEICAGYQNETKDFCGDDIGSPLMCQKSESVWYVLGLASSGGDCRAADRPGIFEDLTLYYDWIIEIMEEAGYPYQY